MAVILWKNRLKSPESRPVLWQFWRFGRNKLILIWWKMLPTVTEWTATRPSVTGLPSNSKAIYFPMADFRLKFDQVCCFTPQFSASVNNTGIPSNCRPNFWRSYDLYPIGKYTGQLRLSQIQSPTRKSISFPFRSELSISFEI